MTLLQPTRRVISREDRAGVSWSPSLSGAVGGIGPPTGWTSPRRLARHPRNGLHIIGHGLDEDVARRHSAVFACRDLIARIISTLPITEYRRDSEGRLIPVPDQPAWLEELNPARAFVDGSYAVLDSTLARGMGFMRVLEVDRDRWPTHLEDVDPSEMSVQYRKKGDIVVTQWYWHNKEIELWPRGPIWALHGYPIAGYPVSVSPITYAALSILTGLEADDFGHQFFRDNGTPTGVLMFQDPMENGVRDALLDDWEEQSIANRRTKALSHGGEYRPISIAPEESQFLATVAASVADVSRFYGVDPRDIGSSVTGQGTLTYQNPEADNLRMLMRTHRPWIYRLERALSQLRPRGRVLRFDVAELLRVDAMTRHQIMDGRVRGGLITVNEARAELGLPAVEGGDIRLWPPGRQQLSGPELEAGADSDEDGLL